VKKITCESCDSIFELRYSEEDTIDRPVYCPFCGEKCSAFAIFDDLVSESFPDEE
jgi:hypothetical protein